jgi:lipopolysaccharide transport system ATP-binding protein
MSSDPVLEAHGVTKVFRLGEHQSLQRTFATLTGGGRPTHELRAVDDLSFEIRRGECFGIVGANGSGKSTLLQLISQITLPTHGHLIVRGRVLPLLAVGSGFHPELTGRENVVLFGVILGLPRAAIERRLDDVMAFAELERHADTPVKRYSDGMQARLSFAIGMQLPADVYLFDEVLATIDGEFRTRCLDAVGQLRAQGRTVLLVSHDHEQLRAHCDRILWMRDGRVVAHGEAGDVLDRYEHGWAVRAA